MAIEIRNLDFVIPEPENKRALCFSEPTRDFFRRQMCSLAAEGNRRLFVKASEGCPRIVGLTSVHQVLNKDGEGFELSNSHALHRLGGDVGTLNQGKWYEMAIDPGSNLILWREEIQPREIPEQDSLTSKKFEIDPCTFLPSISLTQGEAIFASVARQPHIPFHYHGNGCWVRAHEMCRLIECFFDICPGDVVAKAWHVPERAFSLKSANSPDCSVEWSFHVAPLIKVDGRLMIIDPVLFNQLDTVAEWKRRQGAPDSASLIFTSRNAYNLHSTSAKTFFEETPKQSAEELLFFQGKLIEMIYSYGPMPYSCRDMSYR